MDQFWRRRRNSKKCQLCDYSVRQVRANNKCLHQMWQCTVGDFGKQNCRRRIQFFGQIWERDALLSCTLGDYWRFGSRLIDMTQHSGIPTLMTTSIWRDFLTWHLCEHFAMSTDFWQKLFKMKQILGVLQNGIEIFSVTFGKVIKLWNIAISSLWGQKLYILISCILNFQKLDEFFEPFQ